MKWPRNILEASRLQDIHRRRLCVTSLAAEPEYVAGVDAAFLENRVFAAACLYRLPELLIVEQSSSVMRATFPYIPGYLFFREGPAIMEAVQRLSRRPDVLIVDGQGIAHPRGIGSASHIGVLLDIPSIGCAKKKLVGEFEVPGEKKGNWSSLMYSGRIIGAVLRTKDRIRPLFISPGHHVDLKDAIQITLACTGRYRIPEPLRCADFLSRKLRARG